MPENFDSLYPAFQQGHWNQRGSTGYLYLPAEMWSETVSLGTRPVSDQKIGLGLRLASCCGLGLAVLMLFCETRSCHARRHNDLEGHSNF